VGEELNMAQALHVEPKALILREIAPPEFFASVPFRGFGEV
jgi:hypothetical protein